MTVRIYARSDSGTETEVTEGVQALYDLVIDSMDWGSGFLTVEDALPVVRLALTCGFRNSEAAERYVRDQQHSEAQSRFLATRNVPWKYVMHDHVYSPAGRCMWPLCNVTSDPEPLPMSGSL